MIVVAANAGIDDTQDLYVPSDGVTKPNLKTIEVDLLGPTYAAYLALHYFRTNEPNTGGKVVITSSTAGLYGCPPQPQYGTAKFGCIGLARSMGENAGLQRENITINAICPSFVPSGLAPPEMLKRMSATYVAKFKLCMRNSLITLHLPQPLPRLSTCSWTMTLFQAKSPNV